ncbi:hypothetical protein BJY52DRAFT_1420246 [Lactarius psammicola]|nr:hypothetical protein BJY52DRAFT_1420246 [Lactarius psammicola]
MNRKPESERWRPLYPLLGYIGCLGFTSLGPHLDSIETRMTDIVIFSTEREATGTAESSVSMYFANFGAKMSMRALPGGGSASGVSIRRARTMGKEPGVERRANVLYAWESMSVECWISEGRGGWGCTASAGPEVTYLTHYLRTRGGQRIADLRRSPGISWNNTSARGETRWHLPTLKRLLFLTSSSLAPLEQTPPQCSRQQTSAANYSSPELPISECALYPPLPTTHFMDDPCIQMALHFSLSQICAVHIPAAALNSLQHCFIPCLQPSGASGGVKEATCGVLDAGLGADGAREYGHERG